MNSQLESTKPVRLELKVNTDPRTIAFTIGRKSENLRAIGKTIGADCGETVFMKYVKPSGREFGYWKVLSVSKAALDQAEVWLLSKETECIAAIKKGTFKPWIQRAQLDERGGRERGGYDGRDRGGYDGRDRGGYDGRDRGDDRGGPDQREHDRRGNDRGGNDRRGNDRRGNDRGGNDRRGNDRRGPDRRGNDRGGNDRRGNDRRGNDRRGPDRRGNDRRGDDRGGNAGDSQDSFDSSDSNRREDTSPDSISGFQTEWRTVTDVRVES
jgi:hypothetical protein